MAEEETELVEKKKRAKKQIPAKEVNFLALCTDINTRWKREPLIITQYNNQLQFESEITDYTNSYTLKSDARDQKKAYTKQLANLSKEISSNTKYVKHRVQNKFSGEENAKASYSSYGLTKKNEVFSFPVDRDQRVLALKKTAKAMENDGVVDQNYGVSYWKQIAITYESLHVGSQQATSTLSANVQKAKDLKPRLRTTLNAIIFIIKGNYPENYKGILRDWGFQKESY